MTIAPGMIVRVRMDDRGRRKHLSTARVVEVGKKNVTIQLFPRHRQLETIPIEKVMPLKSRL